MRPATVQVAIGELVASDLVADVGEDADQRWLALPTARDPLLEAVDLHGAHDFRHTFATWLEDAGIPARFIDEVIGHEATSRGSQQRGSAMGAHYRHTTPEMAARIATAIEQRLTVMLEAAEQALEGHPSRSSQRVFLRSRAAFSGKSLANGAQSGGRSCVVPGGAQYLVFEPHRAPRTPLNAGGCGFGCCPTLAIAG